MLSYIKVTADLINGTGFRYIKFAPLSHLVVTYVSVCHRDLM